MHEAGDEVEDVGWEDPDVTVGDGQPGETGSEPVDVWQSSAAHNNCGEHAETWNVIFAKMKSTIIIVRFDISIDIFIQFHYLDLYGENLLILYWGQALANCQQLH